MTLPKAVLAALRDDPQGLTTSIPLDAYLEARREDPGITQRLGAIHLLELLELAAIRLEALTGPHIEMPTEVHRVEQCRANVHLGEGVSRCLRLEHGVDVPHSNGDLRWVEGEQGAIRAWWEESAFTESTLGDLIRQQGLVLQLPHLPADVAEAIQTEPGQLSIGPAPEEHP